MKISLELPEGLFSGQQLSVLNDRMRRIAEYLGIAERIATVLDAEGKRIINLGDAAAGGDAMSRNAGDRRYAQQGATSSAPPSTTTNTTVVVQGGQNITLAVPATLGINSSAAPLVTLESTKTCRQVDGLLKIPSQGGDVSVRMLAAGRVFATLTFSAGQTTASVQPSAQIRAGEVIVTEITSVGVTYGGNGLTVILRF